MRVTVRRSRLAWSLLGHQSMMLRVAALERTYRRLVFTNAHPTVAQVCPRDIANV